MKIQIENIERECLMTESISLFNECVVNIYILKAYLKNYVEVQFYMNDIKGNTIEKSKVFENYKLYDVIENISLFKESMKNNDNTLLKDESKIHEYLLSFKNISLLTLNDYENICNSLNLLLPKKEIEVYYNGFSESLRNNNYFHVDECLLSSIHYNIIEKLHHIDFKVLSEFERLEYITKTFMISFLCAYDECYINDKKSELFYEVFSNI